MGFFSSMFEKRTGFEVVGGQNMLPKSAGNAYVMLTDKKKGDGVVTIKKKNYYYLGSHLEQSHTRSAGKTAAGAIIGGVLTGGVGAVVGGAIGARKKDTSLIWIDLADYETKQEFSIQVKPYNKSQNKISEFTSINPNEIGLE